MNGVTTTEFGPNVATSRAMLATILYRLEGEPEVDGSDFTDVKSGSYYAEAVAWASAKGIVTSYGDGTLSPGGSAVRGQIATILMQFLGE